LVAEVLFAQPELVSHLVPHGSGYADGTGVGEPLKAGGYVDPLPVDPIALYHDVTEVNTDAKLHPSVREHVGVLGSDCALNLDGAAGRIEGARKLGEEVIPRRIDYPTPMLADQAGDVLAVGLKGPHRHDLVFSQEAAVADSVGAEDSGQFVNDGVGVHRTVLAARYIVRK